ncbi:ABC transporter substrate-binding protein [Halalkalibacter sp. APA_J-10(15)]|uniref:ABC transporter substrate-binding protein n=1 Tax=Halalkalibacter sp. APA_J-10(15) TaxID=2933805 RepID=UPI001FF2EC00|nr:ABC transporter substrate-binding protein [Halalkalibacter sp. APA_J-10(15)]MCK0473670.1 ABC transporter substrate-binding protein [Halalkalibacter sp. APA_J-10(15)]
MLKRNGLLVFIILVFSITVVVGCSGNEETSKDDGSNNQEQSNQNKEEPEEVTLKWLVPSIDQPDQERVWAEFNELLQDHLPNTSVEFENVTIPEYADRWQLVAAAQEPVDIAWSFWNTPLVQEVEKGAYLDITDLMEEYAPDLVNELDPSLLDLGKVDGRQYAIPNWQPMTEMRVTMRTLKENFEEFWSVEEAEAAFYGRDERPLDEEGFEALTSYFQRLQDAGKEFEVDPNQINQLQRGQIISDPFVIRMQDENFEVVNKMELPELKLFFDYTREWYEKGFIRQDIVSNPDGHSTSEDDDYINFHAYFPGDELGQPDTQFVPLDENYYIAQLIHSSNTVIPNSAENPERAMQLIELMHTEKGEELFNFLLWGIEGEHYEVVGENRIETIGYAGEFPANPGSEADYGLTHYFTGNTLLAWETQANPENHWAKLQELHENAWTSSLIGFKPNLEEVRTEYAQIQTIYEEYFQTLLYGVSADYEDLLERMIESMNQSGAQTIMDELQRQVDEYVEEYVK